MTRMGVAALLALAAWGARGEEGEGFGQRGRVLFTGSVSLQHVSSDAIAEHAVTTFDVSPGLTIFVGRNVAVGARLQLSASAGGTELFSAGLLPSIGYNLDLSPGVSWLPQLQTGFSLARADGVTYTAWSLGAYAPLIVRPKGNLFVGVGPDLLGDLAVTASNGDAIRRLVVGVRAMLGGWF
jgi:hypothetical protein